MKKEILVLLLPDFAEWEVAFLSATLNEQIQNISSNYFVKTVGITKEPVKSIGLAVYMIKFFIVDYFFSQCRFLMHSKKVSTIFC